MNTEERNLIEGLYQRLQQAEAQGGARDGEAEALIRNLVARQPAATYLLTQVALMQEHALRNQQGRIEELERELAERPQNSGFLGGLFGGGKPQTAAPQGMGMQGMPQAGYRAQPMPMPQGGGFMAGAMQTAMGVAGGVLLGNAIGGLFADEAEAKEAPAETAAAAEPAAPAAPAEPEVAGGEEQGGLFGGLFGGFGDFGGFGGSDEEEV